jgi:hypothetical protein
MNMTSCGVSQSSTTRPGGTAQCYRAQGTSRSRSVPALLGRRPRRTNSDAGVPLRDVQIAARYADPRTTTLYDRRRENFDRHAAYVRRRRCGRRLTKPSARRGRNFGKAPIAHRSSSAPRLRAFGACTLGATEAFVLAYSPESSSPRLVARNGRLGESRHLGCATRRWPRGSPRHGVSRQRGFGEAG